MFCIWLLYDIGMAALWNMEGHYIFALWFLSFFFFFSSPNLSGRILDLYHNSTHNVVLVQKTTALRSDVSIENLVKAGYVTLYND